MGSSAAPAKRERSASRPVRARVPRRSPGARAWAAVLRRVVRDAIAHPAPGAGRDASAAAPEQRPEDVADRVLSGPRRDDPPRGPHPRLDHPLPGPLVGLTLAL